jgi:hypothetical protein
VSWSAPFRNLLSQLADDLSLGGRRFLARNFLLDEKVPISRQTTYDEHALQTAADLDEWEAVHNRYLSRRIQRLPAADPERILLAEAPDTFVLDPALAVFSSADDDLFIVRMISAEKIAAIVGWSPYAVENAFADVKVRRTLMARLNQAFDLRPVFAGFWEDVCEWVGEEEANAVSGWEDELRDRMGLTQIQPEPGEKVPVFLFRYRVGEVPKLEGLGDGHPLVVPTVIDADLYEAFCPAPPGSDIGQLVNLAGDEDVFPIGEILHPTNMLRPEHLFRRGAVSRRWDDLPAARAVHLRWLQAGGADDYGSLTDTDILNA